MKHPVHHAHMTPDKIAYRMAGSGMALTFAELDARSNQGAQALRSLDVGPGEHIAVLMENCLEFLAVCWAAQRSGVIYTAISRYLGPEEAAYIAVDCGAKVLVTSMAYARDRRSDSRPGRTGSTLPDGGRRRRGVRAMGCDRHKDAGGARGR